MSRSAAGWHRLVGRALFGRKQREQRLAHAVGKRRAVLRISRADGLLAQVARWKEANAGALDSDRWVVDGLALVCEAAAHSIKLDPDMVQIVAALNLRRGRIIEMATGEGKTLVAALFACLGAAAGRRVHVVTANDYLARRDAEWMSSLYGVFGLRVGHRQRRQSGNERRAAHACDVVYGTAAEFGFDYLIDGIRPFTDTRICGEFDIAIVDEIDHILIDEAANPLVVSGDVPVDGTICREADAFAASLADEDVAIDRERREVWLSDGGLRLAESWFAQRGFLGNCGLHDPPNLAIANRIVQALRARWMTVRDVDYLVQDGKIAVLDSRTGRPTRGRFPDGLQQALEVRENLPLTPEQRPVASLSLSAFARLYVHSCGMTGTAADDADEFAETYGLIVVAIPRARASRRIDHADRVFRTEAEKLDAILELVAERHGRGQPILVGTAGIDKSEAVAAALVRRGLPHQVLHAHVLEQEAAIVANAGRRGSITIATKMAGRGTDIELGGGRASAERELVAESGGLLVIGAERQRLRRLDDQLRGRAGRRGDPGETVFFVSLEDELFSRLRGAGLDARTARSARGGDGRLLDADWPRLIAAVQAENRAADAASRRSVRPYDEVMDQQWRLLQDLRETLLVPEHPDGADITRAIRAAAEFAAVDATSAEIAARRPLAETLSLTQRLVAILDACWQEHVLWLGELRQGIGWRALGGRDPLLEFGKDALAGLDAALDRARREFAAALHSG